MSKKVTGSYLWVLFLLFVIPRGHEVNLKEFARQVS